MKQWHIASYIQPSIPKFFDFWKRIFFFNSCLCSFQTTAIKVLHMSPAHLRLMHHSSMCTMNGIHQITHCPFSLPTCSKSQKVRCSYTQNKVQNSHPHRISWLLVVTCILNATLCIRILNFDFLVCLFKTVTTNFYNIATADWGRLYKLLLRC